MDALKTANIEVLEQLLGFLGSVDPRHYGPGKADSIDSGAVGRHVRHILDMYRALMDRQVDGLIDYDRRRRGSRLELDKDAAVRETRRMLAAMATLDTSGVRRMLLKTEVSLDQTRGITLDTTLQRELCYVASHTTHHLAYLGLLARCHGLAVDDALGVAPATASYRRSVQ